jgi:hypothetical protein
MSDLITTRKDPILVALSSLAYRLLLVAYPAPFRSEYAPHMAQAFRDCCLRALRQDGPPGMLRLWSLTLVDWLTSVIEQHLVKGAHMSKARFIRISGWALILGAAALLLATIAATAVSPATSQYDARYRSTDPFFQTVQAFLFPTAVVLITAGIAGLYARYGNRSGKLGRLGLILGVVGGGVTFLLMVGMFTNTENEALWLGMLFSIATMFGGLVMFGVATIRSRTLPRGNYLPVAAGLGFPIVVITSLVYETITGRWLEMNDLLTASIFLVTALALLGLGQILRSEQVEEAVAI